MQMRFSKKKVAKDVLRHLVYAKNEAVVRRGMGLGSVVASKGEGEDDWVEENGESEAEAENKGVLVEDRKGRKRLVTDPTQMYIDQAWVGRGTPDYGTDYRARGRAFRLTLPYTSKYSTLSPLFP